MYILYSLVLALALLVSLPWWVFQLLRLGKYRAGLRERLGFVPSRLRNQARAGCIWVHAVSVGEVLAVSNLAQQLALLHPDRLVFISTTTATGQTLARTRFGASRVFFAPIDIGPSVRAYLKALQPGLLILAETEFWPNLLHLSRKSGAAVAIVNARISDHSFPRYRRFRRLFTRVLSEPDLFLAQTDLDAQRLREIGAPTERVRVSGNLKFDVRGGNEGNLAKDLRQVISKDTPVIVCGSTAEGEEELLLEAFAAVLKSYPPAVLILAPRHPERFDKVADLITTQGLPLWRRSSWTVAAPVVRGGVFLLDSVGELGSIYALADIAFVGGSLVPGIGGHNILEPAQHSVPILTGPHTFNFREIVNLFVEGESVTVVTEANLAAEFLRLLGHPRLRQKFGEQARELFVKNSGATTRTLQAIEPLLRRPVSAP